MSTQDFLKCLRTYMITFGKGYHMLVKKIELMRLLNCLCWLLTILCISMARTPLQGSIGTATSEYDIMAQEIYHNLQNAVGDKRSTWPKLSVWSIENRGALFIPSENSIYLDEKIIEACQTFGDQMKDALSFVIAHEMTHFYQAHQWKESGLVRNFMITSEAFVANRQHEAQADIYGAFVTYQAGYNTLGLIPELLDRIYLAYGLDSTASGEYPSLEQRKNLALEACDLAGNLIEIYQTANYMLTLGKFETAYPLYRHVEQSIQFKELHYNIGLCNMMAYLHLSQIDWKYPLSVDTRMPIQRGLITKHPHILLDEILESFHLILEKYDKDYLPAKINLISAYDWLGRGSVVEQLIKQYDGIPQIQGNHMYLLNKANFLVRDGRTEEAIRIYKFLVASKRADSNHTTKIAAYNLAVTQGQNGSIRANKSLLIQNEKGLDGVPSLVFYREFQHNLVIAPGLQFHHAHQYNSSICKLDSGKAKFTLQRITSPKIQSSHGLRIGSSINDIEDQFVAEDLSYEKHVNGSYAIIYKYGLIFKLNSDGIVDEWVSFSL